MTMTAAHGSFEAGESKKKVPLFMPRREEEEEGVKNDMGLVFDTLVSPPPHPRVCVSSCGMNEHMMGGLLRFCLFAQLVGGGRT